MDKVNKQQDKKKKVKQADAAKQTDASQMSLNVSSDDSLLSKFIKFIIFYVFSFYFKNRLTFVIKN